MTLEGTLDATADAERVDFRFTVTNTGDDAIDLEFSDACRAEFVVFDAEDHAASSNEPEREVWRYTDGRAFAQVLGSERLAPGEATTYEAAWPDPQPGRFSAIARLRARNRDCEARTRISI